MSRSLWSISTCSVLASAGWSGLPSCLPATISLFLIAAGFWTHYFFQNLCLCFICLACGYFVRLCSAPLNLVFLWHIMEVVYPGDSRHQDTGALTSWRWLALGSENDKSKSFIFFSLQDNIIGLLRSRSGQDLCSVQAGRSILRRREGSGAVILRLFLCNTQEQFWYFWNIVTW